MDDSLMRFELQDLERSESGSERAWPHFLSAGNNNNLHIAANSKKHDHASAFLSSLAYPSDVSIALLHQNSRGDTPLHCAARKGVSSLVELFISDMTDQGEKTTLLSTKNKQGDTALHLAARNNHFDVVDVLMNEDANLNSDLGSMANNSGECPLYVAAHKGFLDITERLVESTATGPGKKTALHAAVVQDHEDVVELLLEKRPELCKERDESGSTPLLYAASSGNVKILQVLLDKDDSTVMILDKNGLSALHVAAANGDISVLDKILSRRGDFSEITDNTGGTFLHVAIVKGRVNVLCDVLVRCELEELLNQPDDEGNTPLHLAVVHRYPQMISLLLADSRVLPDHINQNGQTPLDAATSEVEESPFDQEKYKIMKDLASRGFKFNIQRSDLVPKIQYDREELKEEIRFVGDNLGIIAVLIATVTFAAGFTLPGGYKSDPGTEQGMATLAKEAAFKVFLISDAIAMMSSIMIIWFLAGTGSWDHDVRLRSVKRAVLLMTLSVRGMMVAFVAGVYVVVSSECLWLAVLICVMAGVVQLVLETFTILPWWQIDAILSLFNRFNLPLLHLVVDRAERYFSVLRPKEHVLTFRGS